MTFDKKFMSQSAHNAAMQANAARDAARHTANATRQAASQHIRHEQDVADAKAARLAECIENFAALDESSLFRKSDKDLAHFQAEHPMESPQYALALNEWNRRLVVRQVNATKFSAFIGVGGIIIGGLMGWGLASYSFKDSRDQFIDYLSKAKIQDEARQQSSDKLQGDNPDQVPPQTKTQPDTE